MKRLRRVVLALIVLLVLAVGFALSMTSTDKHRNYQRAVADTRELAQGCASYRNSPQSGNKFPVALTDLPHQLNDRPLLIFARTLTDPWGNPYRYAIVKNSKGEEEVYVWTERIVDGKLIMVGAKLEADGRVERFGWEP